MTEQSIITECPGCRTRFRVTCSQLHSAAGQVRCGACLAVFDALGHSPADEEIHPGKQPQEQAPRDQPSAAPQAPAAAEPAPVQTAPMVPIDPATHIAEISSESSAGQAFAWTLACLLALLLLAGQYLWFERQRLAWHPSFAAFYQILCTELACDLPPRQELSAIASLQLLLDDHPLYRDALQLELLLENRAEFAQPFPALQLRFTDLQGRLVAQRRFQPGEYLPQQASPLPLMPSMEQVRLTLEVMKPGPRAASYELRLIAPNA